MSFIDEIEVERERIRRRLDALERKLEGLPQGGLSCRISGHTHKWFRIEDVAVQEDGKIKHKRKYVYLPKSNAELAGQLALRQYYEAVRMDLQNQADALDKMQHVLEENCHHSEGVLAREGMAELIVPKLSRKDAYLEAWLAEDYPKGAGYEDRNLIVTTETDETPLNAARVGRIVKMMFDL